MPDDRNSARPLRSALFVPGDKPRAIEKAPGLGADALILDLEDAVAPEAKSGARNASGAALELWRQAGAFTVLRVNALSERGFEDDAALAESARPGAVLLPKVEDGMSLQVARERLSMAGHDGPIWAMVETPRALMNLEELVRAGPEVRLGALVAGTNDLAAALRLPPSGDARAALTPHLAAIQLAARAAGAAALDGVCNAYQDADRLTAEARAARAMGFDGKTLIHPAQVAPCNAAFAPSEDELDWARAVREAFADPANRGKGAISVRGGMAERLHLDHAQAILAAAGED